MSDASWIPDELKACLKPIGKVEFELDYVPVPRMPVIRQPISVSQLAELLGVEPKRLIAVEVNLLQSTAAIVLEPEECDSLPSLERGSTPEPRP